jgi:hypothetical protein
LAAYPQARWCQSLALAATGGADEYLTINCGGSADRITWTVAEQLADDADDLRRGTSRAVLGRAANPWLGRDP